MVKNIASDLQNSTFDKIYTILGNPIETISFSKALAWSPTLKPSSFQISGMEITKTTGNPSDRFALIDCNLNKCNQSLIYRCAKKPSF